MQQGVLFLNHCITKKNVSSAVVEGREEQYDLKTSRINSAKGQFQKILTREDFNTELKIKMYSVSAFPFLGTDRRELKAHVYKNICTRMFIIVLFVIVPRWKQPKCLATGEW